jgi:hypothetical protein
MIGHPMGLFHDENEPMDEFEEAQTMCNIPVDEDEQYPLGGPSQVNDLGY